MNEDDFKLLIEANLGMWQGTVVRVARNAADADEAVQLALIAAWRKRNSFRSEAKAASWICRIAINQAYNLIRGRERRKCREQAYAEDLQQPEEERLELLFDAIAELAEPYRITVTVGIAHEFNTEICAALLDCSANTFHWRMHKAKKLLKGKLL